MYFIYFSAIVAYTMASNAPDTRVAPKTLGSGPHVSLIPPRPTTAPKFDLARRQGFLQNTCGWTNGGEARTCDPDTYCTTDPALSHVRCCGVDSLGSFTGSCTTFTSCADYSQWVTSCVSTTELCELGVAYCANSNVQHCRTNLIDLGSGSAFATWYQCAKTSSNLQILQLTSGPVTTTLSTSSTITETVVATSILPTTVSIVVTSVTTQAISSPTTSSTVDSSTSSLTTGVAGTGSVSTSSSSPNPPSQAASTTSASSTTGAVITSSGESTNTGAIAGGTVGGVAVFAGIAGLVLFLLKKRRSSKPPIAETTDVNTMPYTAFVAPAPQEVHSPESSNRWSGGNSREPQMSESAVGPRTSYPYYAPGQQMRSFPQQEISQVNYPDTRTFSRHFNIEMPG